MSSLKSYTRVVDTADGGSAFEDVELDLDEMVVSEGVPPLSIADLNASGNVMFTSFTAFDSDPHPVAEPTWVIMLRGVMEVQVSDGSSRRFAAGDLILAIDTTGSGHVAQTIGDGPFEALLIPARA